MKAFLNRAGIFPYVAGLVLLTIVSYLLVFAPKLKEIRRLQAEVTVKESEMGNSIHLWSDMVRTPVPEVQRWEERVREWRERVPAAVETDKLLAEIGRRAALHNLKGFRLIVPDEGKMPAAGTGAPPGFSPPAPAEAAPPEKTKGFEELRFRVTFLSGYKDMAEFVDGIPRMKRLLSVRNLAISEKDGEMETQVDLTAYYGKPK
jgi:Tfp pilus assembly protein PilO